MPILAESNDLYIPNQCKLIKVSVASTSIWTSGAKRHHFTILCLKCHLLNIFFFCVCILLCNSNHIGTTVIRYCTFSAALSIWPNHSCAIIKYNRSLAHAILLKYT